MRNLSRRQFSKAKRFKLEPAESHTGPQVILSSKPEVVDETSYPNVIRRAEARHNHRRDLELRGWAVLTV